MAKESKERYRARDCGYRWTVVDTKKANTVVHSWLKEAEARKLAVWMNNPEMIGAEWRGKRVRYRSYTESNSAPMTRAGIITEVGDEWITLSNERVQGGRDWCSLTGFRPYSYAVPIFQGFNIFYRMASKIRRFPFSLLDP